MQVVNVALGGTLQQHITGGDGLQAHSSPGFPKPPAGSIGPINEMTLEPTSRLARILGGTTVYGACSHHQALDRIADGLQVVGTSADGLVEAVEHEDAPLVAVQWHPEDTAARDPQQQRIFDVLVERSLAEHA
jgi:putative glutamine amidotransferase